MASPPLDRTRPPAPAPVHPFTFPAFRRQRLASGLNVMTARLPRLPLVQLDLYAPAGAQYDPPSLRGLATMTGSLLDEGTQRRNATEIASLTEQLGGKLSTAAGWQLAFVAVSLLSEHLEQGLDLMAELLLEPTFPEAELERLRRRRLAEMVQRRNDPSELAETYFNRALYGDGIYGYPIVGDEASVKRMSREAVQAFYRDHVVLGGSHLLVAGDLDPDWLLDAAQQRLQRPSEPPPPALPEFTATQLAATSVHVVDRPEGAQTELRIGHVGVPRNHQDFTALGLLNCILGGKFTSRINLNLRERHGYTYSAYSRFVARLGPGPFQVSTGVDLDATGDAVHQVLLELRRIQQELVTPQELDDARSYLRGSFINHTQTIDDLVSRLGTLAIYDLPNDYFETYLQAIDEIPAEEVQRVAREHLQPDRLAIIAVGPARRLVPQLERFGALTVWDPRTDTPRASADA